MPVTHTKKVVTNTTKVVKHFQEPVDPCPKPSLVPKKANLASDSTFIFCGAFIPFLNLIAGFQINIFSVCVHEMYTEGGYLL